MTQQEYRTLIKDYRAAARILDYVRSDRRNLSLPPLERPSDKELERAEDDYAELAAKREFRKIRTRLSSLRHD
jgi:hypothetical protein